MASNVEQAKEITDLTQRATDLFMAIVALSYEKATVTDIIIDIHEQLDSTNIGLDGVIPIRTIVVKPDPPVHSVTEAHVVADFVYEFNAIFTRLAELGVPWELAPNVNNHSLVQQIWNDHHDGHTDLPNYVGTQSESRSRTR